MTSRVLVIGEVLIDVVRTPDGAVSEHVGGSPANVATGLARLGHSTDFATTFGRDDRGRACLEHVRGQGVEVLPTSRTAEPTSVADATIDESGAATYVFDLHWNLAPVPVRSGVGHVHTGSIAATVGEDTQDYRVELEYVGWGVNEESWSLGYEVIEGGIDDPHVQEALDKALLRTFKRIVENVLDEDDAHIARVMANSGQETKRNACSFTIHAPPTIEISACSRDAVASSTRRSASSPRPTRRGLAPSARQRSWGSPPLSTSARPGWGNAAGSRTDTRSAVVSS